MEAEEELGAEDWDGEEGGSKSGDIDEHWFAEIKARASGGSWEESEETRPASSQSVAVWLSVIPVSFILHTRPRGPTALTSRPSWALLQKPSDDPHAPVPISATAPITRVL